MIQLRFGSAADGDLGIDAVGVSERRAQLVDLAWTWLAQVHGARVIVVRSPGEGSGEEADALVTDVAGAVLAVNTADCVPVLFSGSKSDGSPVVGAAHAGWRGLAAGVLESTVDALRDLGATNIGATIGPCISPAAYEFSSADLTTLALQFGPEVVGATAEGAPALDVRAAARSALSNCSIPLDISNVPCTATDPGYFSWRARSDTGRQASIIWIEPETSGE